MGSLGAPHHVLTPLPRRVSTRRRARQLGCPREGWTSAIHSLRGWKEQQKPSLLEVKLSARPRSGRTVGRWELGRGSTSCGRARGCRFGQPRFPPRWGSGYSAPWLGLSAADRRTPRVCFIHAFVLQSAATLESRHGWEERWGEKEMPGPGTRRPSPPRVWAVAAPQPPASWTAPRADVNPLGGAEGSAQETVEAKRGDKCYRHLFLILCRRRKSPGALALKPAHGAGVSSA